MRAGTRCALVSLMTLLLGTCIGGSLSPSAGDAGSCNAGDDAGESSCAYPNLAAGFVQLPLQFHARVNVTS
eukprot:CAMPEP_0177785646 /NCGR_PEP_ID=MMETSP0491_2-20121128/20460_1 /TAXON_ID=63592 /ORGANISM="Tetraselmis chuii, Strain PLY429" /LENGTH=70 /DNA_ID=CAMNT_0019306723 /DNA_START=307 /DNA_END=515 /DNA_ORIENTATION=+